MLQATTNANAPASKRANAAATERRWKMRQCRTCQATFFASFTVAVVLIVAGFIVPPMGVIDGSVLTAVGELVVFPALAFGMRAVELGYDLRLTRGNTSLAIENKPAAAQGGAARPATQDETPTPDQYE